MRILLSLIFLLAPSLHAADTAHYAKLKIYDQGKFTSTTYFNQAVSTNTVRTNFAGIGPLRTTSKLKGSTVRIIDCPKSVNEAIRMRNNEEKTELLFTSLKISQCIKIDYTDAKLYFVEFEYQVSLTNAHYDQEDGKPIVWVGLENKDGLREVCFYHSSFMFRGEDYLNADLAGVADVDRDGKHEIVINDCRYAGRFYRVIGFKNGKLFQKEILGDSGD